MFRIVGVRVSVGVGGDVGVVVSGGDICFDSCVSDGVVVGVSDGGGGIVGSIFIGVCVRVGFGGCVSAVVVLVRVSVNRHHSDQLSKGSQVDSIAVSVFVVILVEFDKY